MNVESVGWVVSSGVEPTGVKFATLGAVVIVELPLNGGGIGREVVLGATSVLDLAAIDFGSALLSRLGNHYLELVDALRML